MSLTSEDRDAATRLAIHQARDDLLAFVMLMNPSFSIGPHHRVLCDQLMRLEKGETDRLMIFISPRSQTHPVSYTHLTLPTNHSV